MNNIQYARLGELICIKKGKKPLQISDRIYSDKHLPYLLIESMEGQPKLFTDDSSCPISKKEDTLLVWDGARSGLSCTGLCGYVGSTLVVISKKSEIIDSRYLFYFISSKQKQIHYSSEGTGIPHVSRRFLENLQIPIPPLPEQKKIAKVLSGLDNLIFKVREEINKLKFLKKSIINNVFQKGITNTRKKQLAFYESPKTWQIVQLKEISKRIGDGLHSTPTYTDKTKYFFVNGNNLVDEKIQINNKTRTVSHEEYLKHIINLNNQSLLMSINGTIGNLALFNNEKIILGKSACYINLSEKVSRDFIMYQLSSDKIQNYFFNELTGTTIKNLSLKTIRSTPIILPPLDEQNKIAENISLISKRIKLKVECLNKYKKLKVSISQDLFSGRKRVNINHVST